MDAVQLRVYRQALANRLAIVIGSAMSSPKYAIPTFARAIEKRFDIKTAFDDHELFARWNDFVTSIEEVAGRPELTVFARQYLDAATPTDHHKLLATIPVSNFVLTSFERSFITALTSAGRHPVTHDFDRQMIGSWRETDPSTPNVFFMLPSPNPENPWWSLKNQITENQNIQLSNINDMLAERDLLMLDYSADEAEYIFHLRRLALAGEKIINVTEAATDMAYWGSRGVLLYGNSALDMIQMLIPKDYFGKGRYGAMDQLVPRLTVTDAFRDRFDVFVSYYSGDADFVRRLEHDLEARNVHLWRDEREIAIGDSLSQRIQEGLERSHSMMIILSPDALSRSWVNDELRAGYARRLGGKFEIFPVLHKDCPLPPLLADYRYADFRDAARYDESLSLLERAIKNAVRRAATKDPTATSPLGSS